MSRSGPTARRWLTFAASAYLLTNVLHLVDHFRQGLAEVNDVIKAGGGLLTLAGVVTLLLVLRQHALAARVAAVVGSLAAALVVASHLVPHWSLISNSYIDDVRPDAVSWLAVWAEVGAASLLGAVGLYAVHTGRTAHRRGSDPSSLATSAEG